MIELSIDRHLYLTLGAIGIGVLGAAAGHWLDNPMMLGFCIAGTIVSLIVLVPISLLLSRTRRTYQDMVSGNAGPAHLEFTFHKLVKSGRVKEEIRVPVLPAHVKMVPALLERIKREW